MTRPGPVLAFAVTSAGTREQVEILVDGSRIAELRPADARAAGAASVDPDRTVVPGWVDVHIHGAGGFDVMDGISAIREVARFLAPRGVTAFLPSAVSAPLETLRRFARDVADARREQEIERERDGWLGEAEILGAHLEGPAIDPGHPGAHDPRALITPAELLAAWDETPEDWGAVRIVTLAPELPGGAELVRRLAVERRVASLGHTAATYDEAWSAFDAGAGSVTHLFDAMPPIHHRAPGPVVAALRHPTPSLELIADGVHVAPAVWPLLWHVAGERLVVVSDAMAAAGLGDGDFALGRLAVSVREGRATLADGTIASSTALLDTAFANVLAAGIDLASASHAFSAAPARLAGATGKGRLERGADADMVVVDRDGAVERVMIAGRWLDAA